MLLLDIPQSANLRKQTFGVQSDFTTFVTADDWTCAPENSGTAAVIDGAGGIISVVTGATDNDEAYLKSTAELFLFADGKPLMASCRMKCAEISTNKNNVAFGFMNAVGANSIIDDGGGLVASYSGAMFFKKDGGLNWNVECSIGTTRTGTVELTAVNSLDKLAHTAGNGSAYQWLDIEVIPISSTQATATFFIDGVLVQSIVFTYTSATEMQVFVGIKNGSGAATTLLVDYLGAFQKR